MPKIVRKGKATEKLPTSHVSDKRPYIKTIKDKDCSLFKDS